MFLLKSHTEAEKSLLATRHKQWLPILATLISNEKTVPSQQRHDTTSNGADSWTAAG